MTKITKRTIAIFLAVLMIVTSVPFSALAISPALALKSAITAYESKMDGTVYTNMKPAFDAYVKAKQDLYSYEVGGRTDVSLDTDAAVLNNATAAMTEWTSPKGTATASFPSDSAEGTSYDGYTANLLYSGTVTDVVGKDDTDVYEKYAGSAALSTHDNNNENPSASDPKRHKTTVAMYYPVTVMLYDGETTPIMPVAAIGHVSSGNGMYPVKRYFYALYPAQAVSTGVDTVDKTPSTTFGMKLDYWNYYDESELTDDQKKNMRLDWRGAMAFDNQKCASKPELIRQSKAMWFERKGWDFGVQERYPMCLANAMQYTGGDAAFENSDNEYLITQYINWRRYTGDDMGVEEGTPSDYMTFTAKQSHPTYVINYKALIDAVKNATSVVADNPSSYLIDNEAASNMLGAVEDAISYDPNYTFTNTSKTVAENTAECAEVVQSLTEAVENYHPTSRLNADYVTLENAIKDTKSTYTTNNADKYYTDDSFGAFATAYDNAITAAKAVADNGFGSTTAGNELYAAYNALNVRALDYGTSGNTTYDFDEEEGKLVISPKDGTDGKMEDYSTASDSPFGNNPDIREVVIDPSVTYIGAHTFDGAENLETITVPAGATYGEGAFDN